VHTGVDAAFREQAVIDRVPGDAVRRRAVDRFDTAVFIIGNHVADAVHAADANRIEELRREFREQRADAAPGDYSRPGSAEKIRKLPHPVEIRL